MLIYRISFEEAIERISNMIDSIKITEKGKYALIMAKQSLEKQIPKKPKSDNNDWISCPTCNETFAMFDSLERRLSYCGCCGQRLDWSETK